VAWYPSLTHLAREGRMTVAIGRRELLAALGGGVIVWPLAARAQQQAESGSSNFATDRVTPSRDNQILCHENHFCIGIYSLFTTPCTIIYVCYPISTPARFRPLGPPMFDSPKIAS
jgi:hypothetical protein